MTFGAFGALDSPASRGQESAVVRPGRQAFYTS